MSERPFEIQLLRRADIEAQRYPQQWEIIPQSFSIPLGDFEGVDAARITAVRFVFDRTEEGEVVVNEEAKKRIRERMEELQIDALVVIGGDGTMGIGQQLFEAGVRLVGVPKTIDNDLLGTEFTFGFDSALLRLQPLNHLGALGRDRRGFLRGPFLLSRRCGIQPLNGVGDHDPVRTVVLDHDFGDVVLLEGKLA